MKKVVFITILIFSSVFFAHAQKDTTSSKDERSWKFDRKRLFLGGGLSGGIYNGVTAINISPLIGYRFTDQFVAGPRLIYNYYSVPNWGSYSNYGYGLMGRYFAKPQFFLQTEYQEMYYAGFGQGRTRVPSFLVGGGYYQRPVVFYVLYDLLWRNNQYYPSPLRVNFGIMF